MPPSLGKEKPIDRWLGIVGIVVAVILYLAPKTPSVVVGGLIAVFALLIHPLWNFWWIEARLWRRISATALLIAALCYFGQIAWPPEYAGSRPHLIDALWYWWNGHHGRWFDRVIGAIGLLALILLSLLIAAVVKVLGAATRKPAGKKGFLDYKYQLERSVMQLPLIMQKDRRLVQRATACIEKLGVDFSRSSGSTAKQLGAIKVAAIQLDRYSARMRGIKAKLEMESHLLSEGLCGWSAWVKTTQAPKEKYAILADALRDMRESTHTMINAMLTALASIESGKGISATLDAALDRLIQVRTDIMRCSEDISAGCDAALAVFDSLPTQQLDPCTQDAPPAGV
jgi:hypothetical protein